MAYFFSVSSLFSNFENLHEVDRKTSNDKQKKRNFFFMVQKYNFSRKNNNIFLNLQDECASGYWNGSGYFLTSLNGISERIVFIVKMLKIRNNMILLIHPKEVILSTVFSGNYFSVLMSKEVVFRQQYRF